MQGRLLDTRTGAGAPNGSAAPLAPNTWIPVQAGGVAGVPSTGVSSIEISVTAFTPAATGLVKAEAQGTAGQPDAAASVAALLYTGGAGTTSTSSIIPVSGSGAIEVQATTSIDSLIVVQGYYSSGSGATAPGGYVPVNPTSIVDTRTGTGLAKAKLATNSTTTIQISGKAGVPADASAVFVMLAVINPSATSGYFDVYPDGTSRPANVAITYPPAATTLFGTAVGLGSNGQIDAWVGPNGSSIDFAVTIVGYYSAANGSSGAFTSAGGRIYDSRVSPNTTVPANGQRQIPVGGVNNALMPADGVSAYAINAQIVHSGTHSGYLSVGSLPSATVTATYFAAGTNWRNDLITVTPASDGTVWVVNNSPDSIDVILDLEGWFAAPTPATPVVTSSAFVDGESGQQPAANATFSFTAGAQAGNSTATAGYVYTLDDSVAQTTTGSTAAVSIPITDPGSHYLDVRAIDASGRLSDITDFYVDVVGGAAPATDTSEPLADISESDQVTSADSGGGSVQPNNVPPDGGTITYGRLSCGHDRRITGAGSYMDIRFNCRNSSINFGIRVFCPPSSSYVFESGMKWTRLGHGSGQNMYHDEACDYNFHGSIPGITANMKVLGFDTLEYSYQSGNSITFVNIAFNMHVVAVP